MISKFRKRRRDYNGETIAVLPGDGIGKEITKGAIEILEAVAERFHHTFSFKYGEIGGSAIDDTGVPLPDETVIFEKK